ncbi:MAG: hypothetical protein HUK08_09325 [Bacteroidaceae bacterium]|nr:hypothetical protein [Oscillospiraceae bacterium]MCF0203551.1 hypothetical protein [Bacteroidaceae bacterium]
MGFLKENFDKVLHFSISAAVMFALTAWLCPVLIAALVTLLFGTIKEWHDMQYTERFDMGDWLADIAGIAVGFLLCWATVGVASWGF